MSYPARGPIMGIDGKANAAGHRRDAPGPTIGIAEVAA